jgi:hypothetical protein
MMLRDETEILELTRKKRTLPFGSIQINMSRWLRNNRINIILGIEITVTHPNINLLFPKQREQLLLCYSVGR